VELFTGGKALRQARSLFVLGQALFKGEFNPDFGDMGAGGAAIPSQEISLGAYGKEDSDGNAYAVVAYGQNVDISPQTPKPWAGNINLPGAQKWTLTHLTEHQALANPDPNRTTIGVCEHVGLSISGAPPDAVVDWDTSAGGLAVSGSTATFLAPDQPATATITANINGHPLPPLVLNVIRPSGIQFANPPLAKEHLYNCCDAGFHTQVIILPTSVCFYNIDISEMHTNAIADGCYSSFNGSADPHKSWTEQGFGWLQPNDNNNLPTTVDYCEGPPIDPPYSEGHFEWDIPWNYRLHGATDDGYNFKVIHQTTDATSTGKCTTSKANMTVSFEAGDANANW